MESLGTRVPFALSTVGVLGYTFHLMATSLFGWDDASTLILGFGSCTSAYYSAFAATNWASFLLGLVLCVFVVNASSFRLCAIGAFLLSVGGWAALWAASADSGTYSVAYFAGVCTGVSNGVFFLLWQNAFALMDEKQAQSSIVVGSGLAGVPILVDLLVGSWVLSLVLICVSLVGSLVSLLMLGGRYPRARSWASYPLRESKRAIASACKALWKAACCVAALGFVPRFLSASSAGSNTKRFPPAFVPAARQEQPQGSSYLKVSSAPGRRVDKFRHSLALENTRLWCLVEQTFLRSSIQGRFLVSTWQTAYGQRLWKHGE